MKPLFQFFCFLWIGVLLLACGGGGDDTDNSTSTIRFKAVAGDNIIAYDLSGTLLNPGDALSNAIYDTDNELAEISLKPDKSYRLKLRRNGLEMMETIVLSDQFTQADSEGNLDAGEISGLTTALSWAAFRGAELNPFFTVESALLSALERANGTSIVTLADISKSTIENSPLFSSERLSQMNLIVVTIARLSVHFENNLSLSEAQWNSMIELLTDILLHSDLQGSTSEAESLANQYMTLFNQTPTLSFLLDDTRITNQYVDGATDRATFLTWAQTTDLNVLKNLFTAVGASF